MRAVGKRQTVEGRVTRVPGELVDGAFVDRRTLPQLPPGGIRVDRVVAARVHVVAAAEVEQPAELVTVEQLRAHRATYPPSTGKSTPVMLAARSETRYTAASAQSSAVIGRPSGCMVPTCSAICSTASGGASMPPAAAKFVYGIAAGQIALTRMPNGAHSIATAFVSWCTPPFVAPYTVPPQPTRPAMEPVFRMTPPSPCCLNRTTACLHPRNTPR